MTVMVCYQAMMLCFILDSLDKRPGNRVHMVIGGVWSAVALAITFGWLP